jgi:predicted component of type VI protein secretion system
VAGFGERGDGVHCDAQPGTVNYCFEKGWSTEMDAKLVVVAGETKATEIKLRLPSTIGRGRDATLTIPHPLVSRQHCEIFEKDGFLVVRDLGSLNGTFIDDERITESVLHEGALLTVGTVTFRAVYSDDPNLSAPVREQPAPPPARQRKPVFKGDPGGPVPAGDDDVPTSTPGPVASADLDDEPDDEFAAFLNSVDVEGEDGATEETPESIAEPTIESVAPDLAENVESDSEDIEEVEEVEEVSEGFEPEEVEAIDDVEDAEELDGVEEVEQVDQVDEVTPAAAAAPRPASRPATEPAAKAPPPAAPGPKIELPAEPQEAGNEDDDELQSFLKDLEL